MFFPFCVSFHCSYHAKGRKNAWVRERGWDEEWGRFCTSISCIGMKSKEFLSFEITVTYIQLLWLLNFCVRNNWSWEEKKRLNKSWWRMISVWEKSSEIKPFFSLLLPRLLRPWAAGARLHPYDLNKQHALAEVTGAVEGGWDSWVFPWGNSRCQSEALGDLVSPTKPCWLLPDSDSQTKGEQESGFMLWSCTLWPSGFFL